MHYLPHSHHQQSTPPDLCPCIAELLRTGYHPSELVLRVERVIEVLLPGSTATTTSSVSASASAKRRSYRIFLSDGELVIQALLGKALHRFASTGEIVRGAVLGLERFEVRRGRRVVENGEGEGKGKGKAGEVVFLAVEGLRRLWGPVSEGNGVGDSGMGKADDVEVRGDGRKRKREDGDDEAIGKGAEGKEKCPKPDDGDGVLSRDHEEENTIATQMVPYLSANMDDVFDSTEEDVQGHEVHELLSQDDKRPPQQVLPEPPLSTEEPSNPIQHRKPTTPPLNDHQPSSSKPPAIASTSTSTSASTSPSQHPTPFPLPISRPLNLHPLTTLLHPTHPLPKRNYLCDILAIITWISPQVIKRRHMPPKRDLRVMDASIAGHPRGGMSVSVFVDAETFMPAVGTVGLFRGLKTHEWEGVSLNAYEKECKGREWFVGGRGRLEGLGLGGEVEGLEGWWGGREREGAGESGGDEVLQ